MAMALDLLLVLLLAVVVGSTTGSLTCSCGTSEKANRVVNIICDESQSDKSVTSCEKAYESVTAARGYRYIPGHGLYKLYRTAKDWHAAKETCARDGGRLAVPQDLVMLQALVKLADEEPKMVYGFIGISDVSSKGFYSGVDGKLAPFLNWGPGEPNNVSGDEHCVLLQKDGFMNDFDCLRASPFFCERRLQGPPLPDGYVFVEEEGFFKQHKTKMNFSSAEAACQQEGGHLAVPETQGKAEALVSVLSSDWSNGWSWVGLTDEADEGNFISVKGTLLPLHFKEKQRRVARVSNRIISAHSDVRHIATLPSSRLKWKPDKRFYNQKVVISNDKTERYDGLGIREKYGTPMSKLQYDNWAKGEPNNVDGGEDCVTILINGLLKDTPCEEPNTFLCELPVP